MQWRHVRERTLLVEQKNVNGELLDGQKVTGRPPRTVELLAPLRADLLEWRLASGRPPETALVIPGVDGAPWTGSAYKDWGRRGARGKRLADGRRSGSGGAFACSRRGWRDVGVAVHAPAFVRVDDDPRGRLSIVDIAAQLGHAPTMTLDTYAHVFAELKDAPKVPADEAILTARAAVRGGVSGASGAVLVRSPRVASGPLDPCPRATREDSRGLETTPRSVS